MRRRAREPATSDITSLIDVVFLLLIFFMVSTVFKKDELALLLNLPESSMGEDTQKQNKGLVIELGKKAIVVNGIKSTFEAIQAVDGPLEKFKDKIKDKNISVDLRIDKEVVYGRAIKLLDILKQKGLNNLNLVSEPRVPSLK